jgi:hypothetical protein
LSAAKSGAASANLSRTLHRLREIPDGEDE